MLRNVGGLLVVSGVAAGVFLMPIPNGAPGGAGAIWHDSIEAQPSITLSVKQLQDEKARRRLPKVQPLAVSQRGGAPVPPAKLSRPAVPPVLADTKVVHSGQPSALSTRAPRLVPAFAGPPQVRPIEPGPVLALNAGTRPKNDAARWKLARDLQRELKRVGCYYGKIDGVWGPGSRRSMAGFVANMNATLPVDEPDYILLSLLRGERTQVCGRVCADGYYAPVGGRCQPIVQARKARSGIRHPLRHTARLMPRAKAVSPPVVQGIVTPMAGVPARTFATPRTFTVPKRPHLRVLQPQPAPAVARPDQRNLEIIATRVPSRLGQARVGQPRRDSQEWRASVTPLAPGLAPVAPLPPSAQVAIHPMPPKYYLGAAPAPRPRVRRSRRSKSFRSRRGRESFWRNLERNGG